MRRLLTVLLAASLVAGAFAYGVWVGLYQKPPYGLLRALFRSVEPRLQRAPADSMYTAIEDAHRKTDLDSLVRISDREDVEEKRDRLIEFIWKGAGFPARDAFTDSERSIRDDRYADLTNLAGIDRHTLVMDHGIRSVLYHFRVEEGIRRLLIYHAGHEGDFFTGKETIRFFLRSGYDVLALAMPLKGMNGTPRVRVPGIGEVTLWNHNFLPLLDDPGHTSIRFFADPVAVAVNHFAKAGEYEKIVMVGLSGGGWTTVLSAALDPRIDRSYPVAGACYPFFLREPVADYEQVLPDLYRIADYMELFVLGSAGEGRRQLQIFNQYDPACCWGVRYRVYLGKIQSVVRGLGAGSFDVHLDSTHRRHMISEAALRVILEDLQAEAS